MAKYLRDRRTGELYGWNVEMNKLPYMKEVEDSDDDFTSENVGPDESYVDPETGFPVASDVEKDEVTQAALEVATAQGQAELTTPSVEPQPAEGEPQYDDEGHMLLGYTADDEPVFETDEERDDRLAEEEADADAAVLAEEPPPKKSRKK